MITLLFVVPLYKLKKGTRERIRNPHKVAEKSMSLVSSRHQIPWFKPLDHIVTYRILRAYGN